MERLKCTSIDDYCATFPKEVRTALLLLRRTIQKSAPQAQEAICYAIPTFKLYGNLVHFAAYKHHIGFYPGASGIAEFENKLARFKHAKGSVQFPPDKPLPLALVKRIVKFRVQENMRRRCKNK